MTGNDLRAIAKSAMDGPLLSRHISALLDAADQIDSLRDAVSVSEQAKRKAMEALRAACARGEAVSDG